MVSYAKIIEVSCIYLVEIDLLVMQMPAHQPIKTVGDAIDFWGINVSN